MYEDEPHRDREKHHKNHASKSNSHKIHPRPKVLDKRSLQHRRNLTHWCQRTVDAFELLAQIGEGTYGQVYKAKDTLKSEKYSGTFHQGNSVEIYHLDIIFKLLFLSFCRYSGCIEKSTFGE